MKANYLRRSKRPTINFLNRERDKYYHKMIDQGYSLVREDEKGMLFEKYENGILKSSGTASFNFNK